MAQRMVQPTASQQAAAQLHLERRSEWRYSRTDGVRYVSMPSGRSGRVYRLRADGRACPCDAYQRYGYAVCSHMLAIKQANEQDAQPAIREVRGRYEEIFGICDARGCDEDRARGERWCDRHVLCDAF
jgi:hypothetical protein